MKNKTIKTNIERYGVDNPLKNKDILKKAKATIVEYGIVVVVIIPLIILFDHLSLYTSNTLLSLHIQIAYI